MKTIALLACFAVGCGGSAFTPADPAASDKLPGLAADSAMMTDAGVTSGNDAEVTPPTEDGGVTVVGDASPTATPDAASAIDAPVVSDAAPEADKACDLEVCAHSCQPVYQAPCCKEDGACGCAIVLGDAADVGVCQ